MGEPEQRRRTDRLATAASGFAAALALAVSTYNVVLQRQQIGAQVWPRMSIAIDYDEHDAFRIVVTNRGVGPADVKSLRVLVDGEPTESWLHAEGRLLRRDHFQMAGISGVEGEVISPGQDVVALTVTNKADARELLAQEQRLVIESCYCSTLGDCWITSRHGLGRESSRAAKECPREEKPFQSIEPQEIEKVIAATRAPADAGTD